MEIIQNKIWKGGIFVVYNTKNVPFDTQKIQQELEQVREHYLDPEKVLREDTGGFPVAATIDLVSFSLPLPKEEADKLASYQKKIWGKGKLARDINMMDLGMGMMGPPKRWFNIQAHLSTHLGMGGFYMPILDEYLYLDVISSDIDMIYRTQDKLGRQDILDKALEIERLARTIERDYFDTDEAWKLRIKRPQGAEMQDLLVDMTFLGRLHKSLEAIVLLLDEKCVENPHITYEKVDNVLALNIIKIIERGSDMPENQFTGRCTGLALEALIINKRYNATMTQIVKSFDQATDFKMDSDLTFGEPNRIANVGKQYSLSCTYLVNRRFTGMENLPNIRKSETIEIDNCSDMIDDDRDFYGLAGKILESIGVGARMGDIVVGSAGNFQWGIPPKREPETELLRLLVPIGMDLSGSFKAKYV